MLDNRGGRKSYPVFRDLTTEELEQLLCEEFDADGEPDTAYIKAIMEVIREREAAAHGEQKIDVDAAWKDFQENYQGQAAAYASIDCETPSNHLLQIKPTAKPRRKSLVFRIAALAAALVVLLNVAASAFGLKWIDAFVRWGSETFGFETKEERMGDSDGEVVSADDVLKKLQVIVADKTSITVVPKWVPEGTEQKGDIKVDAHTNGLKVLGTYTTEQGEYTILIRIYDEIPESYRADYQMNKNGTQTAYEAGGIMHYLADNNGNCVVTWHNETVEVHIQGALSLEDLKKMVDSIYEE